MRARSPEGRRCHRKRDPERQGDANHDGRSRGSGGGETASDAARTGAETWVTTTSLRRLKRSAAFPAAGARKMTAANCEKLTTPTKNDEPGQPIDEQHLSDVLKPGSRVGQKVAREERPEVPASQDASDRDPSPA